MKRARFLIHAASLLVPPSGRAPWLREWLAELYFIHSRGAGSGRLIGFARGAFADARWHAGSKQSRDAAAAQARSPSFCLAACAALIVAIAMVSGLLPVTRSILMPLPYRDPQQIVLAAQTGPTLGTLRAVRAETAGRWNTRSKLLEGLALYTWTGPATARVSANFFDLLGARFTSGGAEDCSPCVVLSSAVAQRTLKAQPLTSQTSIMLGGGRYRVAGVLEPGFWFLSRDIGVWQIGPPGSFAGERAAVVARLGPGVSASEAERELSSILYQANAGAPWSSLVRLTPLQRRVRSVFESFGLALGLAVVVVVAGSRVRLQRLSARGALFLLAKTSVLLAAVFLAGVEFTHAASITMLGGGDPLSQLLSTWLFLLGSMGALAWSVRDQQARCRVCLRRLALPTRVGCPGCLLLDWAGTELVCMEGHGMLHIPELVACWEEPERWTALDDSWQQLFVKS